jgi:hypothetical protein
MDDFDWYTGLDLNDYSGGGWDNTPQSYGVPYGWNDQDVVNFFGNDSGGSGTYSYSDWLTGDGSASFNDPSTYNLQGIIDSIAKGAKGFATGTDTGIPWLNSIADLWAVKNVVDKYGRDEDWNDLLSQGRDMATQMREVINQRDPVKLSPLQQMMIASGGDMYSNAVQNLNTINRNLTGNQQNYTPYQLPGEL